MPLKLIILNCYSRNSLAVINSLDPSCYLIGGAVENNSAKKWDGVFKSKKLRTIFRHSDPTNDAEGFKNDITSAINLYKPDAVIATGTTITDYLSFFKLRQFKKPYQSLKILLGFLAL